MAVQDLWTKKDGTPSARHGRGKRWRVSVDGYPTSAYRTRAQADKVNAERIAAGPPHADAEITVGVLLDQWLAGKKGKAPDTVKTATSTHARVHAYWADTIAAGVRRPDVVAWLAEMTVTPRSGERKEQLVPVRASRSTKAKCLQALSGALEIAVDRGIIDRNPCAKVSAGRMERKPVDVLQPSELQALAERDRQHAPLIWMLGTCGLRIGEARRLNVGDVDARRRRLVVRESKTRQAREVPIPAQVIWMLDLGRDATEPLFTTRRGGRLDGRSWARGPLKEAAKGIGRPDVTPHIFRHTAASLAIQSGADVKAVQRMLGHATAAVTLDVYGHLWDRGLDDVAVKVGLLVADSGSYPNRTEAV